MNQLTVQLFGTVRVAYTEGDSPRFRSQRTMALLGYLIAKNRPVSRDALAGLFWPDEAADKGRGNLRRELHNLNQILPNCWETDRQSVGFSPVEGVEVDLLRFVEAEQNGHGAAAVELIGGDFLSGIYLDDNSEFETWLLGEQEHWRQRIELILNRLIDQAQKDRAFKVALGHARKLLQLMPWNETVHRQAMLFLARLGDVNGALAQFEKCQQALATELGVEPMRETLLLYERMIAIRKGLNFQQVPSESTALIGREMELEEIDALISDPHHRLISLVGPGGIGKTHLALAAANRQGPNFLEGVVFVPLVGTVATRDEETVDLLIANIAASLNYKFAAQRPPIELLIDFLSEKEVLLVLDNFEQLRIAAPLLEEILQRAPAVKMLVTSRERLGLKSEWVVNLSGLPYPLLDHGQAEPLTFPAVRLFVSGAQRIRPTIEIDEHGGSENLAAVLRICQLVDGHPLALELASSWLSALRCKEIAAQIAEGVDLLATDTPMVADRHRSMRVVLQDSWTLLSDDEQKAFRRLSVFRDGFTLEAAEQVAQVSLATLASLIDKSWMKRNKNGRYQIHELVRQYGDEQLATNPNDRVTIKTNHTSYYVAYLEARQTGIEEVPDPPIVAELDLEVENFRAVTTWLLHQHDLESLDRCVIALWPYFQTKGTYQEATFLLSQMIDMEQDTLEQQVRWRYLLGEAHFQLGELKSSRIQLMAVLNLMGWGIPKRLSRKLFIITGALIQQIMHRLWPSYFIGRSTEQKEAFVSAAKAALRLGSVAYILGDYETTFITTLHLLNRSEQAGIIDEMSAGYAGYALTASLFVPIDRWASYLTDLYAAFSKKLLPEVKRSTRGYVLEVIALASNGQGQWSESEWAAAEAIEIFEALKIPRLLGECQTFMAEANHFQGKFEMGRAYYEVGYTVAKERGDPIARTWGLLGAVECSIRLGDRMKESLIRNLEDALALPQETLNESYLVRLYGDVAQTYLTLGEIELARQAAETAIPFIERNPLAGYWALEGYTGVMDLYLNLWDPNTLSTNEAAELEKKVNSVCQGFWQMARVYAIGRPRAYIYQGTYDWRCGRRKKAQKRWQEGLVWAKRLEMRFDEGLAYLEMARHLPAGDEARIRYLNQAEEIFAELKTAYHLKKAQILQKYAQ